MLNSDRFLNAYNEIGKYLEKITAEKKGTSFYSLIVKAAKSNKVVKQYEYDLKEFADLRNAIVHERTNGHVIAEPNEQAVNQIETIVSLLLRSPKVIPEFGNEVLTVSANEPIAKALTEMYEHSFSQIPVYKEAQFIALLTANTISRWLGTIVSEEIVSLLETSVEEVLKYSEDSDNYIVFDREKTLFEVLENFEKYEKKGKKLEAILLTQKGDVKEKLLGIITVWDLPRIYTKLEIKKQSKS